MKKINQFSLLVLSCVALLNSCSKSASDEFKDANGNVEKKLIKTIRIVSGQETYENRIITFSYDSSNRLTLVNDGEASSQFNYANGELKQVSGSSHLTNVEDFYQSPLDAFEKGAVMEYDNKGNPIKLSVLDRRGEGDNIELIEFIAEISYDSQPNPYYYTMDSAGIIDALDKINLNFSTTPQSQELVKARTLLFVNNPSKLVYKGIDGNIIYNVEIDYTYDDDKYPESATVTAIDMVNDKTGYYYINYEYKG